MPSYYDGAIEPIEYMAANFTDAEYRGFLKGNIIKYISRAGKKGDALEDLKKAQQYLAWLIEEQTPDASDIADRQAEWLRLRDTRGWT